MGKKLSAFLKEPLGETFFLSLGCERGSRQPLHLRVTIDGHALRWFYHETVPWEAEWSEEGRKQSLVTFPSGVLSFR